MAAEEGRILHHTGTDIVLVECVAIVGTRAQVQIEGGPKLLPLLFHHSAKIGAVVAGQEAKNMYIAHVEQVQA